MHFQLNTENMHYSPERFLKWMTKHPERYNTYLNRHLKDIEIVIKDKDIYLYGDDYRYICLNNCDYNDIEDIIDLPELIDEEIIEDPIFVIQNDYADDSYTVEQYIVGITDNYDDALAILNQYPDAELNIAKRNQPIDIPAGAYIE
jgi:hypothetical protein